MAVSTTSGSPSYVYERRVARVHRYHWPAIQLNVWMLVMLAASCCMIGVFAVLMDAQQRLLLFTPWFFSYWITVGALMVVFICVLLWLISQRRLLPSIVLIGAFMFFVLWMAGVVVVGIEMWGSSGGGSVGSACDSLVNNVSPTGNNPTTLAWLQQRSICQQWQAVFALGIVGCVFLVWLMVIAIQVFYDEA
jgi:glucan phosphoethanolaminetransferase (alkaline phosphatase superfamily)